VLDQRPIYHIKGAIGGKVKGASSRTAAERRKTPRIMPFAILPFAILPDAFSVVFRIFLIK
jgi:hypothetical protein